MKSYLTHFLYAKLFHLKKYNLVKGIDNSHPYHYFNFTTWFYEHYRNAG